MTSDKVAVLGRHQVWDSAKGCFRIGLRRTRERYHGQPVYRDAYGQKLVIL